MQTSLTTTTEEEEITLISTSGPDVVNYENDWTTDFGCLDHMIGSKERLARILEYKEGRVVVIADNPRFPVAYIGKTLIAPHLSLHPINLKKSTVC